MKLKNKTIGIWGYGRVGTAAATLCTDLGAHVIVYDASPEVLKTCPYAGTQSIDQLFAHADYIIPSPGVDITQYKDTYSGIWLSELDLFQSLFHKKIIAITGSIGKTSVTHMLTQALKAAGWRVHAAGNIGTPMLSMIAQQDALDAIVLEVSSFQLEHTQSFAPDLALWTNLYPNHLDRHKTVELYCAAKYQIIAHQTATQQALISTDLYNQIIRYQPKSSLHFFNPTQKPIHHPSGFAANWLIIEKALELLHVPFPEALIVEPLEHRLEHITTINGATFINDSKSTTPASTLAAVNALQAPHITLLLGGLSKGIDRTPLIETLATKNITVHCFGKEAVSLFDACKRYNVPATCHKTLESAVQHSLSSICPQDIVLLSPAGSSFDEFTNYEQRGTFFKSLITCYKKQIDCD